MVDIKTVKQWYKLACGDFAAAKHLTTQYPPSLEVICYLCEQSAEKMLKGFLEQNEVEIPKTHDLARLCRDCSSINDDFDSLSKMCSRLTVYAVHVRYPSDIELTEHDMKIAIKDAEQIMEFVTPILKLTEPELSEQEQGPALST